MKSMLRCVAAVIALLGAVWTYGSAGVWAEGSATSFQAATPPHGSSRTLLVCSAPARPGEPMLLAASFEPVTVPATTWSDRLLKIRRGGFDAVHLVAPWNLGQAGSLQAADLRILIGRATKAGLKVMVGPPLEGPTGDAKAWFEAARPVLTEKAESILWLQAPAGGAAALAALAKELQPPIPVIEGKTAPVPNAPEKERPYIDAPFAAALRAAAAGVSLSPGATAPQKSAAIIWRSPFAGQTPPLLAEGSSEGSLVTPDFVGGLPVSYYEAHLFADVLRALGPALAEAAPVPGASADAAGVTVAQRQAGDRGFLFVQAPGPKPGPDEKPVTFRVTFTDPVTKAKVTVPQQEALRLRTFGPESRILPLNLPLPGSKARIRYCTAEVYGAYSIGGSTVVLISDDQGAPNEISLALDADEEPPVIGTPAEPVWDEKTKTLTLGFIASIDESVIHIGTKLMLVVVPTERAQRTWVVRGKDAKDNDVLMPLISGAYFGTEGVENRNRLEFQMLIPQGSTQVTAFLEKRPFGLSVNTVSIPATYADASGILHFGLRSPQLATLPLDVPPVQVLRDGRFLARAAPDQEEFARPDFADAAKWPTAKLDRARGAGWYRIPFRVPSAQHWHIPWQLSLQVKGTVKVYLNGVVLGTVTGDGTAPALIDLPDGLLLPEGQENLLAACATGNGGLQKVGITPFMEHAVQELNVAITFTPTVAP